MKTLGRVLIILIAFVIMMGATYSAVSASGSASTNGPAFQRAGGDFPGGVRPENRDGGSSIIGVIFGLLKNTIIVAFIVAVVVFFKNTQQQKRRAVPIPIK